MTSSGSLPKLHPQTEIPRPVLNRLFIVIGALAILAIAAAFVVPRFIQWGDYRDRMQAIAGEVLGAPVEIVGDIEFSLLPQPQLRFAEVRVGEVGAPVLSVAAVEADFSLIDFLRDRYLITRLVLDKPSLEVRIDAGGRIDAGVALAQEVRTSNVSVANAGIVDGTITIMDARSGDRIDVSSIDGELRMEALRGPFSFQGGGEYEGAGYTVRLGTSAFDADGSAQLSLLLRPRDERFSLTAEGRLETGEAPRFSGNLGYRQHPPAFTADSGADEAGRGDLVVTSTVEATAARILLPSYTIVPDENRGAARLTGAADVTLGKGRAFNAVVSGGVLALPPRDATADPSTVPYEIVRLLAEVPVPPTTRLPGTLGVDIAELNLRAVSLRNVRLDAKTDGEAWAIETLSAQIAGSTSVTLKGALTAEAGEPTFAGILAVSSARLDTLSRLWRQPPVTNPLVNVEGTLETRVALVGETLSLSDATLTIGDQAHPFSAEIGFASTDRHLNLRSDLGALDAQHSAALFALLPDIGSEPRFGVTFPKGRFEVTAEAITLDGLPTHGAVVSGTWEGGVVALDQIAAEDAGGVRFKAKLTAFGTLARPEFSGTASVAVSSPRAPALQRFFNAIETPQPWGEWLRRFTPAELELRLDAPSGEGGQGFGVTGRAGEADIAVDAQLGFGLVRALRGPLAARVDLRSDDPAALTAQLGLGATSLFPETGPMHMVAVVEGTAANSFETTVRLDGGGESLAFAGNVIASNPEAPSGNGNLQIRMSDLSGLSEVIGIGGIWLPAIEGRARIDFDRDRARISDIAASSGGESFTGELTWSRTGANAEVSGRLNAGPVGPNGILNLLGGPAASVASGTGYWPDGPASLGEGERTLTGRVAVTTPAIIVGGSEVATEVTFNLAWDAAGTRIRDFTGTVGGGRVTAELSVCCAGLLPQKQVSGRFTLEDVAFASLVPAPIRSALGATLDATARFEGTGDSLSSTLAAMTGEGSYRLTDITVRGFDPAAFDAIPSLRAALDMEAAEATQLVVDKLAGDPFTSQEANGSFTIAGGVLRSPNLALEGEAARLFGGVNVRLSDLSLSGGFAMTPTVPTGPDELLTQANAKIVANLAGTVLDPQTSFDVAGVVDTIMVRAFEIEVARLEQLRAEDEARQRAAAEERARAAAEEAARKAAEEEAARRAAEEEAAAAQTPPLQPGFNLTFEPTPPANQF
jgi:hypothetical protein